MSFYSWKREFYPRPAHRVARKDALAHSLKKWEGLRPSNLRRHGVVMVNARVFAEACPEKFLSVDADSCALCYWYTNQKRVDKPCRGCPLERVRGGSCDEWCGADGMSESPYVHFLKASRNEDLSDPEPMIFWLRQADKMLTREKELTT